MKAILMACLSVGLERDDQNMPDLVCLLFVIQGKGLEHTPDISNKKYYVFLLKACMAQANHLSIVKGFQRRVLSYNPRQYRCMHFFTTRKTGENKIKKM